MCIYCKDIYKNIDNFNKLKDVSAELVGGKTENILNPLISIIITVYKRRDYLCEAINSVLYQTNIDFVYEVIVICDDPFAELHEIDNYKDNKNIFFYKNTRNCGLYNSTNIGAEISHGRYIAFLHDDDILYPEYLSEIHKFLQSKHHKPQCVLVNRDVKSSHILQSKKEKVKFLTRIILFPFYLTRILLRKPYKTITLREGLTYLLSNVYKAPSCGTLFEKECFIKLGGFNQDFWPVSDYYFFLKFNQNNPIYMLRKKLACYRWLDNLSQNKSIQHLGFEHLAEFFKSKQPVKSINYYYSIFRTEVLYSKFKMINEEYRNEIIDKFPEIKRFNKIKWIIFKMYNISFRFIHDIV
jgi:glycosyltransferase involved in cell wall biosynthesis